jgi:microcystin-dependent protein
MSTPFLGEIRVFSFNYAPQGWALCNGQQMTSQQNPNLFKLIGTTYGGSGSNFNLPNLQGDTPMHFSDEFPLASSGGSSTYTLSMQEMPSQPHTHTFSAAQDPAGTPSPAGATPAGAASEIGNVYAPADQNVAAFSSNGIAPTAGAGHNNMQPHLVLNFCIALQGIYPSQS